MASTLGRQNPIRYRGYEYDEESGLYYLRSRYYNPDTGRFISADSVMGRVGEVLSHNLYCYCGNNPVSLIDKNGNIPQNGLVAYGTSCEIDLALSISIIEGVVEDSKGNVADFITYVGIPESWQIPQAVKSKDRHDPSAMGLGGIGISYSNVLITANNADIFDFSGPGSYIGGSVDAGLSIGVDALVLGKYLNEITDTEIISGYQISFGIGIGINWVHEGNAYTIIRLREDKGKPIPYEERYWQ